MLVMRSACQHVDRPGAARDRSQRAIFEILDEPEEIAADPGRQARPGPVTWPSKSVTFGTTGPTRARDIALEIPGGRTVAHRSHGIREDDARRARPRFYDAAGWQVLVDGVDVRTLPPVLRQGDRGHLAGSVPFSASIRDNIALGMPDAPHEAVEAAARRRRTTSSSSCRTGTTRSSGSGNHALAEDSASGSRSRGRCSSTPHPDPRRRDRPRSTRRRRPGSVTGCAKWSRGGRPSSSPTACRRSRSPTRSWCSTASRRARDASRVARRELGLPRDPRVRPAAAGDRRMSSSARPRIRRGRRPTNWHTFSTKMFPTRAHPRVTLAAGGGPGCPVKGRPKVKVWQAGSHLTGPARGPRRRLVVATDPPAHPRARPSRPSVQEPNRARDRHPRRLHVAPSRRTSRSSPSTTGSCRATSMPSPSSSPSSSRPASPRSRCRARRPTTRGGSASARWPISASSSSTTCSDSLGYYERNRTGAIISRITNDVEALDQLVTDGISSLVQNSLLLLGTAVVLFFSTGVSRSRPSSCFRSWPR